MLDQILTVLWKGWLTREGAAGRIIAQLNMSHCDVPTDCFSPKAAVVGIAKGAVMGTIRDLDQVFSGLARSSFRQRFHLGARELAYLHEKGLATVLEHARDFIDKRLAPADPANDGKQTPYRGHPVFIAQHATATCCRSCLEKWHGIRRGQMLNVQERTHVVAAIERWLRMNSAEM
jgi:hypothetical protein